MLSIKLKRTIHQGRRAYRIKALKVDGKPKNKATARTPDGDVRFEVGDIWFVKDYLRLLEGILSYVDWVNYDEISMDNLPYFSE